MTFEFATAGRIVFGPGTLGGIGALARELGAHALVVTGSSADRAQRLCALLEGATVRRTLFRVRGEPKIEDAEAGVLAARNAGCDFVIGFGGGSAIDTAKAVAALVTNAAPVTDYLEVVGKALPLMRAPAPCIAIPTTAGTGAEVTRNAVLAAGNQRVKVSLRSPLMLPRLALVDPELTLDLPPALTAATGLDAVTQLLEPYVSPRANPMTDALCRDGLTRAARALPVAVARGQDRLARTDMALASLYGGLALANAGLGAVHGFAGPIGGAFPAPHGAVCGVLLPHVTATNVRALRERTPGARALERYNEVARIVTGEPHADADRLVAWLREFVGQFEIPRLGKYGVRASDVPALVAAAAKASSMKANPIALTAEEGAEILHAAL